MSATVQGTVTRMLENVIIAGSEVGLRLARRLLAATSSGAAGTAAVAEASGEARDGWRATGSTMRAGRCGDFARSSRSARALVRFTNVMTTPGQRHAPAELRTVREYRQAVKRALAVSSLFRWALAHNEATWLRSPLFRCECLGEAMAGRSRVSEGLHRIGLAMPWRFLASRSQLEVSEQRLGDWLSHFLIDQASSKNLGSMNVRKRKHWATA